MQHITHQNIWLIIKHIHICFWIEWITSNIEENVAAMPSITATPVQCVLKDDQLNLA